MDTGLPRTWKLMGYSVIGVFTLLGVISALSIIANRWIAPSVIRAPLTATGQQVRNRCYTWDSLPVTIDSLAKNVLQGANQNAFRGCMSEGLILWKVDGRIRITVFHVSRCETCVLSVNVLQEDLQPDGTADTTILTEQSPMAFLGFLPWEIVDTTFNIAEGGEFTED